MMVIGFAGSRHGMTDAQCAAIRRQLTAWQDLAREVLVIHGGCLGADAQFHAMALEHRGTCVIVRPSTLMHWTTPLKEGPRVLVLPAKLPLVRNRDIVRAVEVADGVMLACPDGREHSGTSYTVRYARRLGVEVTVIGQDGDQDGV